MPRMEPPDLQTRPLRSGDWPLIESLFGDNGACGGCWCMRWRVPMGGKTWQAAKGARNRASFKTLVESASASGVLALIDGGAVGWCACGPRSDFPRIERSKALAREWSAGTWSLNCLYVPARWRGRGVATALVEAAIALARAHGASEVEAYPQMIQPGERMAGAFVWTGVPSLYERFGFRAMRASERGRTLFLLPLQ